MDGGPPITPTQPWAAKNIRHDASAIGKKVQNGKNVYVACT